MLTHESDVKLGFEHNRPAFSDGTASVTVNVEYENIWRKLQQYVGNVFPGKYACAPPAACTRQSAGSYIPTPVVNVLRMSVHVATCAGVKASEKLRALLYPAVHVPAGGAEHCILLLAENKWKPLYLQTHQPNGLGIHC